SLPRLPLQDASRITIGDTRSTENTPHFPRRRSEPATVATAESILSVLGAVQAIIVDPEEIAAAEQLHESPSPTKLCQSCLASR
uniref:Uncharacterized protein n=1 Tax=Oryza glaberrima TaxID=4538 RepID=I1P0L7_ORYGL